MAQVRRILCPVDFFPQSEATLSYAASIARNYDAKLHILHVIPPVSSFLASAEDTGRRVKAEHEKTQQQLDKLSAEVKRFGVSSSVEVRFGEIDHEILAAIEEYMADLVVAGTHGRRGFQHWVIGSVCERLLRKASVPILTIGPLKKLSGFSSIKRILIPVDFSEGSAAAVLYGFAIAKERQAEVTLVHVNDFSTTEILSRDKRALLERIRSEMGKLIPAEASNSSKVKIRVEFGVPYQVILRLSGRGKSDMIVLGTHGKSLLERTLLGSNAERVIRGASCPVLAIPPASQDNNARRGERRKATMPPRKKPKKM